MPEATGMTTPQPSHAQPPEALGVSRLLLVAAGQAITDIGAGNEVLGRLDWLQVPAGRRATVRNNGSETLLLLWIDAPPPG